MSYDLRLRLKGLVTRVPGSHTYLQPSYARRVAHLVTKLQQSIFNLASLALTTAADMPATLATALRDIDAERERPIENANFAPAGL